MDGNRRESEGRREEEEEEKAWIYGEQNMMRVKISGSDGKEIRQGRSNRKDDTRDG